MSKGVIVQDRMGMWYIKEEYFLFGVWSIQYFVLEVVDYLIVVVGEDLFELYYIGIFDKIKYFILIFLVFLIVENE